MAKAPNKDHPFKNHQMPLAMRVYFSTLTWVFKALGVLSPTLAGKLALRFFMTPPNFGIPRKEVALRESATLTFIMVRHRKISLRSWGDVQAPVVLLSHGWGGRCTQFHAFILPLVEAGYRVIGFDIPGHGDSEGKRTNMMDVASIIACIEKETGPFKAIIGHSFGTGTALLSIDKFQVKPDKLILIAYFSNVLWITELFGELFSLSKKTINAMREVALNTFATTYGIKWQWEDLSPTQTIKSVAADILLIHDAEDHEVPLHQAEPLQTVAPQAQVMTTTGYGHRKILMNKKVINTVIGFIKG